MRRYIVTKTVTYSMKIDAESAEDAEFDAVQRQDFCFVDDEYSVEEVGE